MSSNDIEIYERDGPFEFHIGIISLHPFQSSHWILYIHESFFGSYGITPTNKQCKHNTKRNGNCLYCEYKVQGLTSKRESYCAGFSLYINYLRKILGIDFYNGCFNFVLSEIFFK